MVQKGEKGPISSQLAASGHIVRLDGVLGCAACLPAEAVEHSSSQHKLLLLGGSRLHSSRVHTSLQVVHEINSNTVCFSGAPLILGATQASSHDSITSDVCSMVILLGEWQW